MDAGDLKVFAAVARRGGMNKAAQELHMVQSNVTQRVRGLEQELGVPLFHRHSRGVTLTAAGAQLLPYAHRIGHLLAEAKRAATDGPVPSGRLCIGSLETTAALRLPPVLAAYTRAHPKVDIVLETGTSTELIKEVLERRLEAAFVVGPVDHPDLAEDRVVTEELVVVTSPRVKTLDDLIDSMTKGALDKILVFRAGCTYRAMLEALLAERGAGSFRRLEFGTLDGILGCVGAGLGITLLPRAVVASALRDGRIAVHALPKDQALVPTVLVRRRDAFVSTALDRFIACAREEIPQRIRRQKR
jgi:DNA-binding transcriptional LysR family regulator